jgi:hypothetical protein
MFCLKRAGVVERRHVFGEVLLMVCCLEKY